MSAYENSRVPISACGSGSWGERGSETRIVPSSVECPYLQSVKIATPNPGSRPRGCPFLGIKRVTLETLSRAETLLAAWLNGAETRDKLSPSKHSGRVPSSASPSRERERQSRVVVGQTGEHIRFLSANLREHGDGVDDVRGLVRSAAKRLRGEVRAVRLNEQAIAGH